MVISEADEVELDSLRERIRSFEVELVGFGFEANRGIETYSIGELQRLINRSRDPTRVRGSIERIVELQEELYRQLYAASGMKRMDVDTDTPERSLLLVRRVLEPRTKPPPAPRAKLEEAMTLMLAAWDTGMSEESRREVVKAALIRAYKRDYDRNRVLILLLKKFNAGFDSSAAHSLDELASLLVKRVDRPKLEVMVKELGGGRRR